MSQYEYKWINLETDRFNCAEVRYLIANNMKYLKDHQETLIQFLDTGDPDNSRIALTMAESIIQNGKKKI